MLQKKIKRHLHQNSVKIILSFPNTIDLIPSMYSIEEIIVTKGEYTLERRNLLRVFFLSIVTFTFGWIIKKESDDTILQRGSSEENRESSTGEIKLLTKQLADAMQSKTDWINVVEAFNVKNDGTVTTTELLNAFNSENKTFYFPDGVYTGDNLPIKSGMKLILSKNATFILKNGSNGSLFVGGIISGFSIEGGKFNGNKKNNTGTSPLIIVDDGSDLKIDIEEIKETTGHAILVKKGNRVNVNIAVATNINGSVIRVEDTSNSYLKVTNGENIVEHGICVKPVTMHCEYVTVNDSTLKNVAQGEFYWGIYFNSGDVYIVKNSKIVNCIVDGSGYGGIFPGGDDNEVVNSDAMNCSGWRGMWIHDSRNINVLGGKFNSNGRDGILVGKAHNVTLVGIQCEGNTHHGLNIEYDAAQTGRYQGATTNKNVRIISPRCLNNSLGSTNSSSGIFLKGYTGVTLIGGVGTDTQSTKTQKRGVESDGLGNGHIIIGFDSSGNINAEAVHISDAVICEGNVGVNNHVKFGSFAHPAPKLGHSYIDQATNILKVHNGSSYRNVQSIASGSTAQRPANVPAYFCYFDTTLGKPIWWNGAEWKDATGVKV